MILMISMVGLVFAGTTADDDKLADSCGETVNSTLR